MQNTYRLNYNIRTNLKCCLSSVIIWVRVDFKKTVTGDFFSLSEDYFLLFRQSHLNYLLWRVGTCNVNVSHSHSNSAYIWFCCLAKLVLLVLGTILLCLMWCHFKLSFLWYSMEYPPIFLLYIIHRFSFHFCWGNTATQTFIYW